MKKVIVFLLLIIVLPLEVSSLAKPFIGQGIPSLISSVDQYYSLTFDGEGEAVVSLRITIRNANVDPISAMTIEIPGKDVVLYGVVQEVTGYQEQVCTQWEDGCIEYGQGQTCIKYDLQGNCLKYDRPCLKKGRACASYKTQYYQGSGYKRLTVTPGRLSDRLTVPIVFDAPVPTNGQTSLLLAYKGTYANQLAGGFNFHFETATMPLSTQNVRVAVNVVDGFYLKGVEGNVHYRSEDIFAKSMMSSGAEQSSLKNYGQSIMNAPGLVKTTSYLDPFESFTVKGTYASSKLRLYWQKITLTGLVILFTFLFLGYGMRKIVSYAKDQVPKVPKSSSRTKHQFLIPFFSGLLTSIAIIFVWGVALVFIQIINDVLYYGLGSLFSLVIILLVILLSLALLIGVPFITGSRFGALIGVFTIVSILGWLIITIIILFFVLQLFTRPMIYY